MSQNLAEQLRLVLVTDDSYLAGRDPLPICQAAVAGGVTMVQLRLKGVADREFLAIAQQLVAALPVPVIINDRLDIALIADAAGVHLGIDDLSPTAARRLVPPNFLIGASVGSEGEVGRGRGADYWGIGPFRHSTTKTDAGTALGWEGAGAIVSAGDGVPSVLIGGVLDGDIPEALRNGFVGVAVVSGILGATDVTEAAQRYASRFR